MSEESSRLFCFGIGYTGAYLAGILQAQQEQEQGRADLPPAPANFGIAGTTRDPEKKQELSRRGIAAHIFDYHHPLYDPHTMLQGVTHLLISTPPSDDGDPTFLMHADDILKIPTLKWVGYLSTIGVYGDRDGAHVDENSEVRPTSKRGSRRARAEEQWLGLFASHGLPVHIFRLAGIYGPGRSALDSVRAGIARRIDKERQAFNRVHVADIAQTLLASMAQPCPGEIYNVCDDNPAPSHEVIAYACTLLGIEPPPLIPYEEADLAPIARSFYKDNKRALNDKIKAQLGISLIYPDYKSGIDACLREEEQWAEMHPMQDQI